ncbi:hypothetical protein DM860_003764 [Cuscuta australis]|uniref:Uncharacterized protein n=1 Tax=Cuscuta australis TaxID=267555 RepID=A0A328DGR4_9ASTE|nr:hypothetical protein DM860_003764 [Cuscuta australis]
MVKDFGIGPLSLPESVCSDGGGGGRSSNDAGEDEVFYEMIEAPKFVDFTSPDHYCPDDRYWFCLRVGCEQKHEQEMDSEKIYKDFVLRVMAARSPNVRLQKALCRNASRNMKCPMSVPSKFSKPRLPVPPSISRKLGFEKKEEVNNPSSQNPISTPKVKTKQVAAKYLTTPRSKERLPDGSSSRSVQNPKSATVASSKNHRMAGKKALAFHSPKKAITLKKSVELRTPLTKLCEGMKRLAITSQKKCLLSNDRGQGKSMPSDSAMKTKSSKKDKSVAKASSMSQPHDSKIVRNFKGLVGPSSNKINAEIPSDVQRENVNVFNLEQTDSKTIENLENLVNLEKHSTEAQLSEVQYHETESDNKENDASADENRALLNNDNIQANVLGEQIKIIQKIAQPVDKNHKAFTNTGSAPSPGLKFKKPKPTNPKPFRLRTDERSILKESNFERKGHHPEHLPSGDLPRKSGADSRDIADTPKQRNNGTSAGGGNCKGNAKESADLNAKLIKGNRTAEIANMSRGKVGSKIINVTPKTAVNASVSRKVEQPVEKKQAISQRLSSSSKNSMASHVIPGRKLATIDESSSKVAKTTKTREGNENGAFATHQETPFPFLRSNSRGRKQVTIPKEPHFHTTHVPRSCARKLT